MNDEIERLARLAKAGATGGKYFKRVPKSGGGYRYYYSKDEYDRAHGSPEHVDGERAKIQRYASKLEQTGAARNEQGDDARIVANAESGFDIEFTAKGGKRALLRTGSRRDLAVSQAAIMLARPHLVPASGGPEGASEEKLVPSTKHSKGDTISIGGQKHEVLEVTKYKKNFGVGEIEHMTIKSPKGEEKSVTYDVQNDVYRYHSLSPSTRRSGIKHIPKALPEDTEKSTAAIDKLSGLVKAGPYIGPRGGKYVDPQHKIPWKEDEQKTGAVGTAWDSEEGRKKVVGVRTVGGKDMAVIQVAGRVATQQLVPVSDLQSEIAWEKKKMESARRMRERVTAAASEEESAVSLGSFDETLTPHKRAVARRALNREIMVGGKHYPAIKELIQERVSGGARVVGDGEKRRLEMPSGAFLWQKDLGKIALDYAEHIMSETKKSLTALDLIKSLAEIHTETRPEDPSQSIQSPEVAMEEILTHLSDDEKALVKSLAERTPDILSKGMGAFYKEPTQTIPTSYLADYLDAFLEEAFEHEMMERTHSSSLRTKPAEARLAQCVYYEALAAAGCNKNLAAALKKFSVSTDYVETRLKDMGFSLAMADTSQDAAERDAQVAGYHEQPLQRSASAFDLAHAAAEQKRERELRKSDMIQLEDDGLDPLSELGKAHARHWGSMYDDPQLSATVSASCPLHGRDLFKADSFSHSHGTCSCPK